MRPSHLVDDTAIESPSWMLTFSDLLTLLLTFFVLQVSLRMRPLMPVVPEDGILTSAGPLELTEFRSITAAFAPSTSELSMAGTSSLRAIGKTAAERMGSIRLTLPTGRLSDEEFVSPHLTALRLREVVSQLVDTGVSAERIEVVVGDGNKGDNVELQLILPTS